MLQESVRVKCEMTRPYLADWLYTYGMIIYCYYWLHARQQRWAAVPPAYRRWWFTSHAFMRCHVEKRNQRKSQQDQPGDEVPAAKAGKVPALKHLCVCQWIRAEVWAYCGTQNPLNQLSVGATQSDLCSLGPRTQSSKHRIQVSLHKVNHAKSTLNADSNCSFWKYYQLGRSSNPQSQLTAKTWWGVWRERQT